MQVYWYFTLQYHYANGRRSLINMVYNLSNFFSPRISKNIPTTKDVEPILEIDGDIRNFEVFLSSRTPVLVARDVRTFLPCTVNLDPKLREIIAGEYAFK